METIFNKPLDAQVASLNDAIATLNSKIATLTLRNINWNYTVSAHGEAHTNLKTLIDNDIPAGYKYLGIVGYRTNNANVIVNAVIYLDSGYSLQILNNASSDISNSVNIQYLCIAN